MSIYLLVVSGVGILFPYLLLTTSRYIHIHIYIYMYICIYM